MLNQLPEYISVPDYFPHCESCGKRGFIVADFLHTNYKGAIYECYEHSLFIDREDELFNLDYWRMSERKRKIYLALNDNERLSFTKLVEKDKKLFFSLKKRDRQDFIQRITNELFFM